MTTDTSEKGLEGLIVRSMTGRLDLLSPPYVATETSTPVAGGTGWILGDPKHYDRGACVDLVQLRGFVMATQPALVDKLSLETDTPTRRQFLARLEKEIGKRGVIDVLRKGIDHGPLHVDLFYGTPSPGNDKAAERFACNRFSVTRQLAYSRDETRRALDLGAVHQRPAHRDLRAEEQPHQADRRGRGRAVPRDRDPREPLFAVRRCVVHFAVDDSEVRFCTELKGKGHGQGSWFLPFNKGYNDGAGNPPNPNGLKTSYLWEEVLTPVGSPTSWRTTRRSSRRPKTPHGQEEAEADLPPLPPARRGPQAPRRRARGRRRASATSSSTRRAAASPTRSPGSPPAHRVRQSDGKEAFDSIIVVTDRRILDEQIQANIKQFAQVSAVVGAVTGSGTSKTQQLSKFLESGKKIIISTVQTFPFLLKEIGDAHRGRRFAIIIDEAHSSQGGKTPRR
jgi:type I restriction enzyme R subunit